jgi:hypothetical protein
MFGEPSFTEDQVLDIVKSQMPKIRVMILRAEAKAVREAMELPETTNITAGKIIANYLDVVADLYEQGYSGASS